MLPTLFALGPIAIHTFNVLLVVALLTGLFSFWRKGREEHYDEMMLFDGLFLSLIFGFIVSRVAFIVLNFSQFGSNVIAWIDIFSVPGFKLGIFFLASGWYVYRYAQKQKWDQYEILDFWAMGVSISLFFTWLGSFFAGIQFGAQTDLPIGLVFPGVFEKHHPVQLYFAIFFLAMYLYLGWAEYRYRTFNWYRAGKNTAQTGYLISVFLLGTGFFSLLMSPVTLGLWQFQGIRVDVVGALVMLGMGAWMLYSRSGRQISFFKKKSAATKLEDFRV